MSGADTARSVVEPSCDHGPHIIEVFADVRCPFAHVGLLRLVERRESVGRHDIRLVVRAWPLELVNAAPLRADVVARGVRALRSSVAPGLFTDFDVATLASTSLPAMRLAAAAYHHGLDVGERVSLELRRAQFDEGLDIADSGVLQTVASRCALRIALPTDDAEVLADWQSGRRRGVIGSPHFFVGDHNWFCPSLRISHRGDQLDVADDARQFDEFTAACFGLA